MFIKTARHYFLNVPVASQRFHTFEFGSGDPDGFRFSSGPYVRSLFMKDSFYKPAVSSHVYSFYQQASLKDPHRIAIVGLDGTHVLGRGPGMTVTNKGNSRVEIQATAGSRTGSAADMDELDSNFSKLKIFTEDSLSLAPSSTESLFVEEAFYSSVRSELEADAVEYETESWSSAVEPPFAKKQKKEVIKRQDVIYELMQTEMHHVRTLKIMLKVYCRALREELHWNKEIDQLLPCLDELLELHGQFLTRFKERRKESLEEGSDRNYIIQKIGDILVQQFSGDTAARMKDKYGVFCSQHNRAVSHYKFLMRENKKFQNLMKKIGNSSIVRRLGVPECILLVTQRITKYPVLVERIIQNTEEGTEDYEALTQALTLLKETITEVDLRVHRSEKGQRLSEIIAKMEPKSSVKLKNGMTFRKHNMENRQLLLDGMLYWKTASGRLKDILAVLLTDVLLLLQEKDQKYIFSSVDAKPPVISLQKLIVREVANEEKAMFLISASLKGPEMYEIHTASKEERNTWMTLIRGAVESCPDEEEINEADIERKQAYERAARIKDYEERLNLKDTYIMQTLSEKLQLYIDMADIYGFDDSSQGSKMRLFIGSDSADSLQGESTLLTAIAEAEKIYRMLCLSSNPHEDTSIGVCALPRRSETFGGYDSSGHSKSGSFKQRVKEQRTPSTSSESRIQDLVDSESEMSVLENNTPSTSQESELISKMQILLQLLFSLKAVITQQDTYFEVQREREKQLRQQSSRGNWLLEQEKQRNFEKQREELANVQKQQEQLKQEKQRWERERTKSQKEMESHEMRLRQREETSQIEKEKLDQERSDLEKQRQAYQHDLERLREAQRAVEKERDRLEQLKKIKKTSVSAGSFAPDLVQVTLGVPHSASFNGEGMQSLEGASQLVMKTLNKTSASVSAADYLERPEVMRRDSSSTDTRPALKNDVPFHLLSAMNQLQRQTLPTKQQIPTKLAALSKSGKEKPGRGKASHRTDSSASVDHRALFASKLSGKDESTVRSRRSASPSLTNSLISFFPQDSSGQGDPINETPPYHSSVHRQSSSHLPTPSIPPPPPPAPANEEDTNKEDVIYF